MENTQVPVVDDDVFSSRTSSNRASSSRIHFPLNEPGPSRPGLRPWSESQKLLSGVAPPVRRGSPLNPQNVGQSADTRRRPSATPESPRHRRNLSLNNGKVARTQSTLDETHIHIRDELEMGLFSDEYDLSHEDPKILQDVQRALKLKARREARANAETNAIPEKSTPASSPGGSSRAETPARKMAHLVLGGKTSPSPLFLPEGVNRKLSSSTSSDPDFSPAVASFGFPTHERPVPSSTDNGRTLDWTGAVADDHERRWAMPLGKRKEKDKFAPLTISIEEQETVHKAKLANINKQTSAQTRRKADITSAQLGRRYTLMNGFNDSAKQPLNLAATSRWFSRQPENYKALLDKAEPFSWLKHLERRKGQTSRSRWNLSALMIEQYLRTITTGNPISTIPEDYISQHSSKSSPHPPSLPNGHRPPSSVSTGLTGDALSFEPQANSKRTSIPSRPSLESATSSDESASSGAAMNALSPESVNANDIDIRDPRAYIAFEQPRSPSRSLMESSDSNSNAVKSKDAQSSLVIPGLSIQVQPPSAEQLVEAEPSIIPLGCIPSGESRSSSQKNGPWSPASQSVVSLKTSAYNRRVRLSAPSVASKPRHSKKQQEDREEQLRREYENKANILRQSTAHNHKIRQFLNKIAAALAKYESLQASQDPLPGVNQRRIPKNVLETFSHDPSAVTRATSKFRGWRAVEDIHSRILRQRDTLRNFLGSEPLDPTHEGCILDQRIEQLFVDFSDLQLRKEEISKFAETVEILLKHVQETQVSVKEKYNHTVSHVSTMYPELSIITALEESYRDQYQQFWDLGMDALTLLLDTVTPFWRTYGKTIGEDVRDFLIIPLYRNEFTGEAKRYRIKKMPRRSFRHWIALIIFFLASITVNVLQYRAAVTSVFNARLPMIPYDGLRWTALPFFWVGIFIQWWAVLVESAIVILELGVIAWWTGWLVNLVS